MRPVSAQRSPYGIQIPVVQMAEKLMHGSSVNSDQRAIEVAPMSSKFAPSCLRKNPAAILIYAWLLPNNQGGER